MALVKTSELANKRGSRKLEPPIAPAKATPPKRRKIAAKPQTAGERLAAATQELAGSVFGSSYTCLGTNVC